MCSFALAKEPDRVQDDALWKRGWAAKESPLWPSPKLSSSHRLCEEIPNEESELNNDNSSKSSADARPDGSPLPPHRKLLPNSSMPGANDTGITVGLQPKVQTPAP